MTTEAISKPLAARMQHPLRSRDFRRLWIGSAISRFGDQFYLVALPWLVLQLTNSSVALGTILMMAAIPRAALMLLGGAVTDRFSPRRILIATASSRSILVLMIAAFLWAHALHLAYLYVLAFAFGVADAFSAPAAQTLMPSLVDPQQLTAANSVTEGANQTIALAAPAPAAFVVKAFGIATAFLVDAVSFLFIIAALWSLEDKAAAPVAAKGKNMWRKVVEGIDYVKKDSALSLLLLVVAVLNFCIVGPVTVGIPFLVKQRFGTPVALGELMTALAIGSLIGMLVAGVWSPFRRGPLMLVVSTTVAFCLAAVGMLNHVWSLSLLLFVVGTIVSYQNIHFTAWFQQRAARPFLGRVMSVLMFAVVGLAPLSLALTGAVMKVSLQGMFEGAGVLLLLTTIAAALRPTVRAIQ